MGMQFDWGRRVVQAVAVGVSLAGASIVGAGVAAADAINDRPVPVALGTETPLQDVLDGAMVDPFAVGTEQSSQALFYPYAGSGSTTIVIEIAGYSGSNTMGLYSAASPTQSVELFGGAAGTGNTVTFTFAGGYVYLNGSLTGTAFDLTNGFGFYLASAGNTWYTEDDLNGGDAHALVYRGQGGSQSLTVNSTTYGLGSYDWVIAFEDLPFSTSDKDYNDFVFLASGIQPTPEPATLALMAIGGLGLAAARRRRRTASTTN